MWRGSLEKASWMKMRKEPSMVRFSGPIGLVLCFPNCYFLSPDKLFRICKHWDVLYPVFHDRASAKPIAPTGTCKPPVRSAIDTRSGVEDSNGHRDLTSRLVSLPQVPAKAVMRRVTITTVTRLTLSQIRVRLMWLVDLMTASMLLQTTVL
ncbi:hypothetical protein PPTG_06391 [Phytophthora nicotianae INRA-310]|uniref:Uncharacterized protein n=1 Tax=Phytophthora nicotianae (strain INRA-310) TaxID=761204 RepID=W2QUM7_PHYN3|nr:hypothetical protein PPTG_06391 [Phytophthora nicotianae INRA-310]ETN16199.1 hypothetical protein PPTG_06391 [Phytophthora nicotianae INRA-310]